jgi:hypothetical protein
MTEEFENAEGVYVGRGGLFRYDEIERCTEILHVQAVKLSRLEQGGTI